MHFLKFQSTAIKRFWKLNNSGHELFIYWLSHPYIYGYLTIVR